jgi:hypothetical protein
MPDVRFFHFMTEFKHIAPSIMRRHFVLSLQAAMLCLAALLNAAAQDVRLVSADANGAVIEFVPSYLPPATVAHGSTLFRQVDFNGSVRPSDAHPGEPDLPYRSVFLRFPDSLNNSCDVMSSDFRDSAQFLLAPRPVVRKGDLGPVPSFIPDPSSYNRSGFVPPVITSVGSFNESDGAILGELRIYPLQYNPAGRVLRLYNRLTIHVTFGRPAAAGRPVPSVGGLALNDAVFGIAGSARSFGKAAAFRSSLLAAGTWFRFTLTDEGMYRISGQSLLDAGIPPTVDPHTIRLFNNGGTEPTALNNLSYDPDLTENAVIVVDGGTPGNLDVADAVIFYGRGTRVWNYSAAGKSFSHSINRFTETNVYWLTYGQGTAKQAPTSSISWSALPYRPSTVAGLAFREDEKINVFSTGLDWLGQPFSAGDQITYVQSLLGLDHSQPVKYRISVGAYSTASSVFSILEHGHALNSLSVPGVQSADYPPVLTSTGSSSATPDQLSGFTDDQSQLRLAYQTGVSDGTGYLDWYEITYRRFLKSVNDVFGFYTHDTTAQAEYDISGFSGTAAVYDVTRSDSIFVVGLTTMSSDTCMLQESLASGSVRHLLAVGPGGYKSPGTLSHADNQDLHGDTTQVANLIITHSDFLSAAQRLKAFHEQTSRSPIRTRIVDVDRIYNEFGGGSPSPMAIRNFIRYCYENWTTPPKYVLLLGHGDFDYRRIMKESTPNWIPPWETGSAFDQISSYADEAAFGTFNNSHLMNVAIGRLPARSLQEANTMVDKIIEYETSASTDDWKLRVTFVADDGLQGIDPSDGHTLNDGFSHTIDAEAVAASTSALFEQKKIYLYSYATEYAPGGRRKPSVNRAITDQINQGTLILNFNGHGNPRLWAHESVFVRETDFPNLHNKGKYFFLVAATCNYANFDNLLDESGGEMLVSMADAGAIAVFSANRPVYQWWNRTLNILLYQSMMQTDSLGRIPARRIGDCVLQAKRIGSGYIENDGKFFLCGDPALPLAFPQSMISIDSINHLPASQTASLMALGRASIAASVHSTSLSQTAAFNGSATVTVFDASRSTTLTDSTTAPSTLTFKIGGNVLFRGNSSVNDGFVKTAFVVPRDISYGTDPGKISVYAVGSGSDAAGFTGNILINGTDSTAPADSKGPDIRLFLDNRGFRPGDVVSASPVLIADLTDSSGINTSGAGVGHRLEAWLDNSSQSIALEDYYHSAENTYQEGTVEYPLGTLEPGNHRLRLRAWDTYNNSSMQETEFDVVTPVGMQLTNVVNYPNPFVSSTVFTFEHNLVSSVDVDIRIYTVAGRLIQTLHRSGIATRMIRIPWDGRDRDADPIANGVYLYKVSARTTDGRLSAEALGKLSILK